MAWYNFSKDNNSIPIDKRDLRERLNKYIDNDDLLEEAIETVYNIDNHESILEKQNIDYNKFTSEISKEIKSVHIIPDLRIQKALMVDDFVECNAEVFNALKIYCSYINYGDVDFKVDDFEVIVASDDEVKKQEVQNIIKTFNKRNKIQRKVYNVSRDVVKYGDGFLEIVETKDGNSFNVEYMPSNVVVILKDDYGELDKVYLFKCDKK